MSSSKPLHDATPRAWKLARRYLRFGTRSADEFRTYLRAKQVPHALMPGLVQLATDQGLLDDRACAALWATRLADQGYAGEAIRRRLEAKGLAPSLVSRVLAPRGTQEEDEARRAREVVQRSLRRSSSVRDPRLQRRLARLLAQRGFDSDLIDRVLAEFLDPTSLSA